MACYNDCTALNLSTCEYTEEEISIGVVSGWSKLSGCNIEQAGAELGKAQISFELGIEFSCFFLFFYN